MCMKSMLKVVFKIFIMLTLFFTGSLVIGQKFLYTYAQNVEPKFMLSGGNITGLCHDIIQKLNEELAGQGIRIEYKSKELKSISEIFDALSKNEIQIFVGAAYSKERESYTTYLQPPLYGLREMFIINSNESKKFDKRQYVRIGVIGGTVTSESLPSIALRQEVVPFKNITEAIKALERKEIDTVFYSSLTLGYMLKNSKGKFETLKGPSEKYYHYIVLSKSVSRDVASKLENTLGRLHKNAVVKELIKKYDLDDFVVPGNVVEILTADWKPYEWYDTTKKEWVGVDVDVVRAVLSKMGYKATFLTFPWTRCVELMKIGAYDGIMSLRVTQERLAFLSFPEEPLSTGNDVLFKLRNSKINLSRLEHIPNSVLCGYTEGYAYGDWFWNAKFKKIAVPDDVTGFKLLKSERIQLFVCNLIVGNELAKELDVDVEHSPVFGEQMIYYLAFSKNYQGSYLSNVFSQRLKEFKLTNDYLRILKRYGITYDDFWR